MPHIHRFTMADPVFIIIQILVKVNGAKWPIVTYDRWSFCATLQKEWLMVILLLTAGHFWCILWDVIRPRGQNYVKGMTFDAEIWQRSCKAPSTDTHSQRSAADTVNIRICQHKNKLWYSFIPPVRHWNHERSGYNAWRVRQGWLFAGNAWRHGG